MKGEQGKGRGVSKKEGGGVNEGPPPRKDKL